MLLLGAPAVAETDRALSSLVRDQRALSITTSARPTEAARPPRAVDPAISAAVFARIGSGSLQVEEVGPRTDPSIEHRDFDDRFRVAKPRAKKRWRPRVMPLPLGFPTGGKGVKLKIRF
jgi:hypothetical protein